jgi:hypothetical protein
MTISRRQALKGLAAAPATAMGVGFLGMPLFGAPSDKSQQLFRSLQAKIYEILTSGDKSQNLPASTDNYVTWLSPGMVFDEDSFKFATDGIASGETGKESNALLRHANDFARVVNSVPTSSSPLFSQDGEMLWSSFQRILNSSQVASGELDEKTKANLDRLRGLLVTTKEETDIVTGDKKQVTVEGPMKKAYLTYKEKADSAMLLYNSKRLAAIDPTATAKDVQDFAVNGELYRSKVRNALDQWSSEGYRNDYDRVVAAIDQITRRSLEKMKADMIDLMERGKLTDPQSNQPFYLTTPIPAGFASGKLGEGWTQVSYKRESEDTYSKKETNSWEAKVKVNYGLFSAGGDTTGSIGKTYDNIDTSNFEVSFEIAQVIISRPWFSPEFLRLKSWRFDPKQSSGSLSDGNVPPSGTLIGYPTTCVFIRNVKMDFAELHKSDSTYKQAIEANASARYGPFASGSAGYKRGVDVKSGHKLGEDGKLEIDGIQLIAMKCQLLPESPNPADNIKEWI